jgi:hypothetical protein
MAVPQGRHPLWEGGGWRRQPCLRVQQARPEVKLSTAAWSIRGVQFGRA